MTRFTDSPYEKIMAQIPHGKEGGGLFAAPLPTRPSLPWLSLWQERAMYRGVPFQSGYLCSGICKSPLEFEFIDRPQTESGVANG